LDFHEKEVREFEEADNARNNTGILHKRQTENNMDGHSSMDWLDIHWTRHSCIQSVLEPAHSWCGLMVEGKARHNQSFVLG